MTQKNEESTYFKVPKEVTRIANGENRDHSGIINPVQTGRPRAGKPVLKVSKGRHTSPLSASLSERIEKSSYKIYYIHDGEYNYEIVLEKEDD